MEEKCPYRLHPEYCVIGKCGEAGECLGYKSVLTGKKRKRKKKKKIDGEKKRSPRKTPSEIRKKRKKDIFAYFDRKYGGMCVVCGTKENITIDHIIPKSKGGSNYYRNLQPMCLKHNNMKADSIDFKHNETK